jgi:ferric-dicitrate binding protein FerR (iron transport regulator)
MNGRFDLRAGGLWRRLADAQDEALARDGRPAALDLGRTPDGERSIDDRRHRGDGRRARAVATRRRRVAGALLALGAAAGAIAAVLALRTPPAPRPWVLGADAGAGSPAGAPERGLVADARSDLPLRFSDGSAVTFRAGSFGRLHRLPGDGADLVLDQGRLEAHVVHADSTLWLVHAGPFRVRVTGTRFAVVWSSGKLEVALYEGAVLIDGSVLGAGVALRAGQRLTIDAGVVRTEPLTVTTTATAAPVSSVAQDRQDRGDDRREDRGEDRGDDREAPDDRSDVRGPAAAPGRTGVDPAPNRRRVAMAAPGVAGGPAAADRDDGSSWLALARQNAYAEAFGAAMRVGWGGLCRSLDAPTLLTLGDVARYAGARSEARQAFEALVARFPHDALAADAVFSLGRLAFEVDQSAGAAQWFGRYLDRWPDGPLADQAAGRLVECAVRMNDAPAARRAARIYLARVPAGPHARLAREVLGGAPIAPAGAPP